MTQSLNTRLPSASRQGTEAERAYEGNRAGDHPCLTPNRNGKRSVDDGDRMRDVNRGDEL